MEIVLQKGIFFLAISTKDILNISKSITKSKTSLDFSLC